MDNLKFKKGLEQNLPKEIEKDTFYVSTDSKKIRLNDAVWEDSENVKKEIISNLETIEKVTTSALNVLSDKINTLDEVVNENEKVTSLISNDLNEKLIKNETLIDSINNEITDLLNQNDVIKKSINEIDVSVKTNQNTIEELEDIVIENKDVTANALANLNNKINTLDDVVNENEEVTASVLNVLNDKKQDKLVSGINIKTINSNSILGEGDIIIPQYDDSEIVQTIQEMHTHMREIEDGIEFSLNNINNNKFDKIKIIQHSNIETEYVIAPNQFHIWVGVDSLELQLGEEEQGVVNEYMFQFSSGDNGTTLTLPYQIKWSDDLVPDFSDPSFIYQISIVNNCATMLKFKK